MARTLLLVSHTPLSADPTLALWTDPPGCVGDRLWKMSGLTWDEWWAGFDRMNVVNQTEWSEPTKGRIKDVRQCMQDRTTLVIGHQARLALSLPLVEWLLPNELQNMPGGRTHGEWRLLPEPDGRFSDPLIHTAIGVLLRELCQGEKT